jgi:glutamate dehydrogenase/leucine dehydrogenase
MRRRQGKPTIFTLKPAQVAGSEGELVYTAGSIAYCMEESRYVAIL